MPSKTEEYLALAQRTANGLTRYWESWTDYLTTASRLYKYRCLAKADRTAVFLWASMRQNKNISKPEMH